jgi:diguanylate cyclase (GGDEF)-like protein
MFQRYTERALRVVFFARYHAATLGCSTADTEHLLLGLLTDGKGIVGGILSAKQLSRELVRDYIGAGNETRPMDSARVAASLSDESERALTYAAEEADAITPDAFIDAEHILLGLLREERGVAAAILRSHGVLLSEVRAALPTYRHELELLVDADVSSDQLFTLLTALADYFRVAGGAALLLDDFDLQTACSADVLYRLHVRLEPLPARDWGGGVGEEFRRTLASEYQHTRKNLRSWERTSAARELDWRAGDLDDGHREALHRYAREELARLETEPKPRGSAGDDEGEGWIEERRAGEGRFFQTFSEANVAFGTDSRGALRFGRLEPESDDDRVVRSPRLDLQIEYGGDRRVDELTALPSLRTFESELERLLATPISRGETIAVIATDLDGFKGINDAFGHYAGDEVLRHIARLLHFHRRQGNALAARIYGDVFFLALGPVTETGARAFAALIRSQVESLSVTWQNQPLGRLSLSTGLAFFPQDGRSPHELMNAAERELRRGRSGGDEPPSPCPVAKVPS